MTVGCILLGRGEDEAKVLDWITVAAGVPGFAGFAVGRTAFGQPLVDWLARTATQEEAVTRIADRFGGFVAHFEKGARRPPLPVSGGAGRTGFHHRSFAKE